MSVMSNRVLFWAYAVTWNAKQDICMTWRIGMPFIISSDISWPWFESGDNYCVLYLFTYQHTSVSIVLVCVACVLFIAYLLCSTSGIFRPLGKANSYFWMANVVSYCIQHPLEPWPTISFFEETSKVVKIYINSKQCLDHTRYETKQLWFNHLTAN